MAAPKKHPDELEARAVRRYHISASSYSAFSSISMASWVIAAMSPASAAARYTASASSMLPCWSVSEAVFACTLLKCRPHAPEQLDNPVASTIVLADRVLDRALRRTE
ncbi:hypothetical protein [Nocardia rhizosphaerihabitans]|uniref:Uncharacterized protein n=1 Tax=Nocardia rhizosphaerihabitans TaxID=1691570 RepID=A0ABQ2KDY6_9NOCA|nr:hypothetical protein [Nocardia rhizosphaerihabitans]GGN78769.1 hypothetical protein GCM10011610_26680 [Nocardia rhizosphaerihabitans]